MKDDRQMDVDNNYCCCYSVILMFAVRKELTARKMVPAAACSDICMLLAG